MSNIKLKKRVTLNDIAQLSGVSKTTASMILNGRGDEFRIKPETCEHVKQIAKREGYRANALAKSLKMQRTNIIGLVIPDLTNYGFASSAKYLEEICRENGLQLIIGCSDDDTEQEQRVIEQLLDRQIDLLITAPTDQDSKHYLDLCKDTPLILLDRYTLDQKLTYVVSNNAPEIAKLIQAEVKKYHIKEFFYFGGKNLLSPSKSRLEGFKQGIEQSGMTLKEEWIKHKTYQSESGYQMLEEAVAELGRLPEAIFTASYTILEGVLRYLTEHKQVDKLLNREVYLSTFDDHHLLNALPFHIHSIAQNHQQMAQEVFRLIKQKLENKECESVKVDCNTIWRTGN